MEINRRSFIASLGGTAAVAMMSSEQKANALEAHMEEMLNEAVAGQQRGAPENSIRGRRFLLQRSRNLCRARELDSPTEI